MAGKVPQFGAWDNGDNVRYSTYFDNAWNTKTNGGGPTGPEPDEKGKPGPNEARAKMPQFSELSDQDAGGDGFTGRFNIARKNKGVATIVDQEPFREPPLNRDAGPSRPPAHNGRAKVPELEGWNGGKDRVPYVSCFDNPGKNKSDQVVKPRTNKAMPEQRGAKQDDGHVKNPSQRSVGSKVVSVRLGKQTPVAHSALPRREGKTTQYKPINQGGQIAEEVATIPAFGEWNKDLSKAEGYTTNFVMAKEERLTPLNKNVPPSYTDNTNNITQSKEEPQKRWWFSMFG